MSKFKCTFRKLVARETTVNSKRKLLSKHSVAVKELLCVFIITNPLDSDSDTDVFDSEDNSSGSSDINSSFSEDDGTGVRKLILIPLIRYQQLLQAQSRVSSLQPHPVLQQGSGAEKSDTESSQKRVSAPENETFEKSDSTVSIHEDLLRTLKKSFQSIPKARLKDYLRL